MILIEEIGVDKSIVQNNFLCDLNKCKGACCTFEGEYGAPVLDEEVEAIRLSYPAAKKYLSERSIRVIEESGFVEGDAGNQTTVCIDRKDCVFVYYDGDIAKCALEKAYHEGENDFRKPISCHLFPVRIGNYGGIYMYYEQIKECKPAIQLGIKTNTKLYKMLEEPLIRAFGDEWFNKLEKNSNGF